MLRFGLENFDFDFAGNDRQKLVEWIYVDHSCRHEREVCIRLGAGFWQRTFGSFERWISEQSGDSQGNDQEIGRQACEEVGKERCEDRGGKERSEGLVKKKGAKAAKGAARKGTATKTVAKAVAKKAPKKSAKSVAKKTKVKK